MIKHNVVWLSHIMWLISGQKQLKEYSDILGTQIDV